METFTFFALRAVQLFCVLAIFYVTCMPQKSYDSRD